MSYGGLGIEQALALVLRSSWMSRCWTLQEASLSKAWFIQFKDNPINIADAAKQSSMKGTLDFLVGRGKPLPSIKRALIAELSRFLLDMSEVRYQRRGRYSRSEIWNLKQLESHQALSFATAWNNFQGRTTSKQEDLHQILAGMADIRAGGLRDLALEDRMKAIIKCHASLPIDILFCPSERMHGDDPANAWAPSSPQGRRLDQTFGSMKIFTDCLYISPKTRSEYLQICFGQSEVLLADRFQVDIPTVGRFWIEIDNVSPEQHHESQNRSICLMSPTLGSDSKAKVWSEILGARFIIQKQEGNNLHMIYDSPFRMFSYDRGATKPSNDNPALQTYPYAPTELAHPDSRIFIDCSLESWPTAPLFYSSLEGPLYTKPAPNLQAFAYIIVHLTWTVSLIITLLEGPKLHIPRLPLIYCFLARVPFVVAEMFWYRRIYESIERDVWSLNVARNSQDFSSYDVINSHSLQLFGLKRGIGTLILAIVFTTLGFHYRDRDSKKWILWLGGMVLLEFTLRSVFYLCWYMLPRYSITRSWLERGKKTLFPKFQSWFVRAREQLVVRHERVPFNEEDAEPLEENAGTVLRLYGAFVKSFWGGGDGREVERR